MGHSTPAYIEERQYFPTGCDPDDYNALAFRLDVIYRGAGKWSVGQGQHRMMTHKGTMLWLPLRMTQARWCRFSFADACWIAEHNVDHVKVNGFTWAEWEAHFAKQDGAA